LRMRHPRRHAQMNVNCLGAVAVTKAFQPAMERSKGVICMVNSFGGVMPLKNMTAYTASKYALAGVIPCPPQSQR
jgi:short-subunit dehydrogenase